MRARPQLSRDPLGGGKKFLVHGEMEHAQKTHVPSHVPGGPPFLGRTFFIISLAINAMLLTLIATAFIATYLVEPGETQQVLGVFWLLSLPGTLSIATGSGVTYRAYVRHARGAAAALHYVLLALGIALAGPAVSYAVATGLLALGDLLAPA